MNEQEDKLGPLQRKWVEALKSGEYKQGQRSLKKTFDGSVNYCCLGVANEVLNLNESCNDDLCNTYKELGLRLYDGEFKSLIIVGHWAYKSLVDMNDRVYRSRKLLK